MDPSTRDCWIFDLDGTLTLVAHDFDAIRVELGLPEGRSILEAIADREAEDRARLTEQLDRIELEIAGRARAQPGAHALLSALVGRGKHLGIVTRNSEANALATLDAAGLSGFFAAESVVGRGRAAPKPAPDGIARLLRLWDARPERGLMIGDFRFDLEAGRAAGVATVYFDPANEDAWSHLADRRIQALAELGEGLA